MEIDFNALAKFLVNAKTKAYAGDGAETSPQRPGFKELEFVDGAWYYRDSYCGFFYAPGQEIVKYKGKPIWAMAYSGGMKRGFHGDVDFAKQTFAVLKKALLQVEPSRPFRGPKQLRDGDFVYLDSSEGDLTDFMGTERIFYKGKEVFKQNYIGGLIVNK